MFAASDPGLCSYPKPRKEGFGFFTFRQLACLYLSYCYRVHVRDIRSEPKPSSHADCSLCTGDATLVPGYYWSLLCLEWRRRRIALYVCACVRVLLFQRLLYLKKKKKIKITKRLLMTTI